MKKIMLTGANGFLGARLAGHWRDSGTVQLMAVGHSQLDMGDEAAVIQAVREFSPDAVVHCAAIADTSVCEKQPELSRRVNVVGAENAAKACALAGCRLIHMSSDQVYNRGEAVDSRKPYREDGQLAPKFVYGRDKWEAERRIAAVCNDAVMLRLTWMFDLPSRGLKMNSNLLWNLVRAAIKREKMVVSNRDYRCFTYVMDVVEAMDQILALPAGIYNAGSGNETSTSDLTVQILEDMGLSHLKEMILDIDADDKPPYRNLMIDNTKICGMGAPFPTSLEGARRCLKDFRIAL